MPGMDVEITLADGGILPAYLARPESGAAQAVVIVVQEIFGINANIREVADEFASQGYLAVAPDLFWRQQRGVQLDPASEADRERATVLMKGLDQARAVEDCLEAGRYSANLIEASARVGAVGYCLGGKLAYLLATREGIDAAVSYYGVAIQAALEQADQIRCPLLMHIAAADHLCPPDAQQAIKDALSGNTYVTIMDYPGVGHAFARRHGQGFDSSAAARADAATAAFLRHHLLARA